MKLRQLSQSMLTEVESELRRQVARLDQRRTHLFFEMLTYHMGWTGEGTGAGAGGKRIRPLLLLLTAGACGADWRGALPAASAVELVHNFTLVHDDIQDNSEARHGRRTVWKKWGTPMGINVGDALFVLASHAVLESTRDHAPAVALEASRHLHAACLDITRGQYLDIEYQSREDLTVHDYWPMIEGKTAALLGCCCQIGSLLGGADLRRQEAYRSFAYHLGLAFQVQDDILGIWGDEMLTGKSAASDLVEGKKTLPVLFGLSRAGDFAALWRNRPVGESNAGPMRDALAAEGARTFAELAVQEHTEIALSKLEEAEPTGEAGDELFGLARQLLTRTR